MALQSVFPPLSSPSQLPKFLHQPGGPVLRVGRVPAALPPVPVLPANVRPAAHRNVLGGERLRDELRVDDPAIAAQPQHPQVPVGALRPEHQKERQRPADGVLQGRRERWHRRHWIQRPETIDSLNEGGGDLLSKPNGIRSLLTSGLDQCGVIR